jgi:hypothetical protein
VNVFAPLSVRVEAPVFVNANAPPIAPLSVTTLGVVTVTFEANVPKPLSVNAPLFTESPSVTAPERLKSLANVRAVAESLESVVPAAIVKGPVPNPPVFPTRTVPLLTVTPPENVFAPPNTNVPTPCLVRENPAPEMPPLSVTGFVTGLGIVNPRFDVNVPAPLNVNAPLFVTSPNVTEPPNEYPFATV